MDAARRTGTGVYLEALRSGRAPLDARSHQARPAPRRHVRFTIIHSHPAP